MMNDVGVGIGVGVGVGESSTFLVGEKGKRREEVSDNKSRRRTGREPERAQGSGSKARTRFGD